MKNEILVAYDVLRRRVAMQAIGEPVDTVTFGMLRQLQHAANASGIIATGRGHDTKDPPSSAEIERACAVFLWSLTAYPQV